jgi:Apc13p protein
VLLVDPVIDRTMSDSSYIAVTNHRKPFDTSGRPPVLELIDDDWAADVLEEEDLPTKPYEVPLMEDDDLDGEQAVVTTGTSSSAVTNLAERRRREEGWNDLGLDQLDQRQEGGTVNTNTQGSSQ